MEPKYTNEWPTGSDIKASDVIQNIVNRREVIRLEFHFDEKTVCNSDRTDIGTKEAMALGAWYALGQVIKWYDKQYNKKK